MKEGRHDGGVGTTVIVTNLGFLLPSSVALHPVVDFWFKMQAQTIRQSILSESFQDPWN